MKPGTVLRRHAQPLRRRRPAAPGRGRPHRLRARSRAAHHARAEHGRALSSQANIAGYKAVMIAADKYQRFFPMLMTAAGTVKAARVVILGVGVAGLQAIATAKRLGAVIEASRRASLASRSRSNRWAPSSSTCPTKPTRKRKRPKAWAAMPGPCRKAGWTARRSKWPSAWRGRHRDHHRADPRPRRRRCWSPRKWSSP